MIIYTLFEILAKCLAEKNLYRNDNGNAFYHEIEAHKRKAGFTEKIMGDFNFLKKNGSILQFSKCLCVFYLVTTSGNESLTVADSSTDISSFSRRS